MEASPSLRRLRLRYPATCSICGITLSPRTDAFWNRETKKALCLACGGEDAAAVDAKGEAGASAMAKADDLEERATGDARKKWGDHAAAVAAKISRDEPSIGAWAKGGRGERRLAAFIEREVGDATIPLYDRIIPGTRGANIDHLFVAPSGVWIVDAKAYKGAVEKRDSGPFWRQDLLLYVGGRNRTKLVEGMTLQLKAVRAALEDDPVVGSVALHPTLCFVESEWGLLARPFQVRGVTVLYPGALRDRLKKAGALDRKTMERIATRLALSLPPARHG